MRDRWPKRHCRRFDNAGGTQLMWHDILMSMCSKLFYVPPSESYYLNDFDFPHEYECIGWYTVV